MKAEEAARLVQTTRGTPMGDYLRDNWIPVMRGERVVAGGAPRAISLFGDKFVVFRGDDGVVGMVDEACPHRGASLALARNVDCELQCLYHGWHIERGGGVTAAPTERARSEFGDRIKTNHYPVSEVAGIVWGYVGPQSVPPVFPMFEWNTMPASNVSAHVGSVKANWLQVLEGLYDPMHVGLLHANWLGEGLEILHIVCDIDVVERDYGFTAAVNRPLPNGPGYMRIKEFAEPFFGFIPMPAGDQRTCIVPIPADDENTHMWYINYDNYFTMETYTQDASHMVIGPGHGLLNPDDFRDVMPYAPDALWGQDRVAMADGHATGLPGLVLEDVAILESQGPIQDRTKEHLGTSDVILNRLRRRLLKSALDYESRGRRDDSEVDYRGIRAIAAFVFDGMDWTTAPKYLETMPEGYVQVPSLRPTGRPADAVPLETVDA